MLTLTSVRKRYGNLIAVDGLSLEVRRGEIFGLLGPNGAGKSTTVNLAVGLLTPDEGRVTVGDGGSPADPAARSADRRGAAGACRLRPADRPRKTSSSSDGCTG